MPGTNGTPLDAALIEKTRFQQNPSSCIAQETVSAFADLLRQTPGYRQALGVPKAVAIPEERSGLLRRVRTEAVTGWLVMELRWDASLYNAGEYSSIRAFLLDGGDMLCVVNARDGSKQEAKRMTLQGFAQMFLQAWVAKDSTVTDYDAETMNDALHEVCGRVFEEHVVQSQWIADGGLCRAMLKLLRG